MRYSKSELIALASQSSKSFDREGVLILKEKQDGFFRRGEGCSVRWFRLQGNLLFYLKGPEAWHEPLGVIILGNHEVKLTAQDENGHWPFQIVWDNGICYKMATFHESERVLWLKAIQMASYDSIKQQLISLKEKLHRINPITDIVTYRLQKGIVIDMNEVPLYELALTCDNLLCDAHGRPPSAFVIVYVKYHKGPCIRYGSTEIVDSCSNPCFSKTILFRASDGLSGEALVRIVVYDMKEPVSETAVPIGFTAFKLNTIQEAQRIRVALNTRGSKTVGFVTINGWSLEPLLVGTSPSHTNDKNSIDIPQKLMCHRRSQSLPPKLGIKLKFPSYGNLLKQNFTNSHQVTYRFHSGLGGDITVHEILAEPKICYQMPIQLLEIFIHREKELLEELVMVGDVCASLQNKQLDLVTTHISLLKHYCHSRRSMERIDNMYYKASSKKEDASLEFAPVNLHLQRMWVCNDTLNKTGFHDVVSVGAFAAHTHKAERTGGLIRLLQQVKDVNSNKAAQNTATTNKIHAEYEHLVVVRGHQKKLVELADKCASVLEADRKADVSDVFQDMASKVESMISLWNPKVIEESISILDLPGDPPSFNGENQTLSTIKRLSEQLAKSEDSSNYDNLEASSSSSSKETSPTVEQATLFSSVPNVAQSSLKYKDFIKGITEGSELNFHYDYFRRDSGEIKSLNQSSRSIGTPVKSRTEDNDTFSFDTPRLRHGGSLRHDYKSSTSLDCVTYTGLVDSLRRHEKRRNSELRRDSVPSISIPQPDPATREKNLEYLKSISVSLENYLSALQNTIGKINKNNEGFTTDELNKKLNALKITSVNMCKWLQVAHAALRLRFESTPWTRELAILQTRRDTCFSQALTAVTSGILCWLCSMPCDTIVKVLSSSLGPLCGFEGLISLYSTEKAMWGDMVVAVEDLQTVVFTLTKVGHSNTATPQISGTRSALTVQVPVSDYLYAKFTSKEYLSFTITAVFFNIGINEKASLAEALGETTPQYHSNSDNLDRLNKYYHKYCKVFPPDHVTATRASSRTKPLEEVMENLKIAVHKKVPKNVEVLHLTALATRLMNGIRFTSCKSAKDRTGMSVTLEQGSILSSEYHLAEPEMKKAINVMRSEGCRRENTFKNIGVRKYAFTKKQVAALPLQYRPPPGTYGSSET